MSAEACDRVCTPLRGSQKGHVSHRPCKALKLLGPQQTFSPEAGGLEGEGGTPALRGALGSHDMELPVSPGQVTPKACLHWASSPGAGDVPTPSRPGRGNEPRRPTLSSALSVFCVSDRSLLLRPFLSPAESLPQDIFQPRDGNSGSGQSSAPARRGWRTAGPSPRNVLEAGGAGQEVLAHRKQLAPSGRELL